MCRYLQVWARDNSNFKLKLRKETRLYVQFDVLEPDAHEPCVDLEDAVVILLRDELEQNILQLR